MLIFLDIDGVMVPAASWRKPEILEDGFPMFSKKAVEALSSILSDNTSIILSTSHRNRFSVEEWAGIFERRGLKIKDLSLLESKPDVKERKDEILGWFNINSPEGEFFIIDDDTMLHGLPQYLKERLISTRPIVGLTPEDINQVVDIGKKKVFA